MKVLITCGPTWVAIDDVRVISNISSGEMGHLIAQECLDAGLRVTLIEGAVTHHWSHKKVKVLKFHFFDELKAILKAELQKKYDLVVHAAAVSDFKVKNRIKGKLSSLGAYCNTPLHLVPTSKIINQIKKIDPQTFLVGFKLENSVNLKNVRRLFEDSGCDLVVANSVKGGYRGVIVNWDGRILGRASNKKILAKLLIKIIL